MRLVRSSAPLAVLALLMVGCSTSGAAGGGGPVDNGRALFTSKGCTACHALAAVKAVGVVGPKLDGIATTAATRKPGMTAEAYIRESIKDAKAFIVPGYVDDMVLASPASDAEIDDLVAFLLTQK